MINKYARKPFASKSGFWNTGIGYKTPIGCATNCAKLGRGKLRSNSFELALVKGRLKAANQQLAFINHLWRQMIVQFQKELFMAHHFGPPRCRV
jgi:hypothetical protein